MVRAASDQNGKYVRTNLRQHGVIITAVTIIIIVTAAIGVVVTIIVVVAVNSDCTVQQLLHQKGKHIFIYSNKHVSQFDRLLAK